MTPEHEAQLPTDTEREAGRLVIRYLRENKDGATVSDIQKHMKDNWKSDTKDLDKLVEVILENGTALGFLDRRGSHYMKWIARDKGGMRRRSSSRRRRRRQIRRRSGHRRRKC